MAIESTGSMDASCSSGCSLDCAAARCASAETRRGGTAGVGPRRPPGSIGIGLELRAIPTSGAPAIRVSVGKGAGGAGAAIGGAVSGTGGAASARACSRLEACSRLRRCMSSSWKSLVRCCRSCRSSSSVSSSAVASCVRSAQHGCQSSASGGGGGSASWRRVCCSSASATLFVHACGASLASMPLLSIQAPSDHARSGGVVSGGVIGGGEALSCSKASRSALTWLLESTIPTATWPVSSVARRTLGRPPSSRRT